MYYDHNGHYHRVLLREAPNGRARALDVGCGEGGFARRLQSLGFVSVVGLDRSPAMVEAAREQTEQSGIEFVAGDFLEFGDERGFDFISAIAVAHHLPFEPFLEHARHLLRPNGVLAVLGLYATATPADALVAGVAVPVNTALAMTRRTAATDAPVAAASMSLREIRSITARVLPGARIRRRLLWRYSLTWRAKPG